MNDFKERLKDAICNNDINFLVENKRMYDINERFEDENNDTLLLYSISDVGSNIYSYFLENGANYNLSNDLNETIVHALVFSGSLERIHEILSKYRDIDINKQTIEFVTPLLLSISIEKYDIAKYLIDKGANIFLTDENGVSPLHLAVQSSDIELVQLLVDKGADLKQKTNKGNSSLALAANGDNDDIIRYIFRKIYE